MGQDLSGTHCLAGLFTGTIHGGLIAATTVARLVMTGVTEAGSGGPPGGRHVRTAARSARSRLLRGGAGRGSPFVGGVLGRLIPD